MVNVGVYIPYMNAMGWCPDLKIRGPWLDVRSVKVIHGGFRLEIGFVI